MHFIIYLIRSVDSLEGRNALDLVVKRLVDNITVGDSGVLVGSLLESERVLHPVSIVSLGEVVSSVRTARLLSVFSSVDSHLTLDEEVLELHGLDEVSVPDLTAVGNLNVFVHLRDFVNLLTALLEEILSTEDGGVTLHGLLESTSDLGSRVLTLGVAHSIKPSNGIFTGIGGELLLSLTGHVVLSVGLSGTSTEDNEIEKRVGTESVSAMDRGAGGLTASRKTRDDVVDASLVSGDNLSLPVRRDTTHVVMDSGEDGNGLLGGINTGKDVSGLNNTRKSLEESLLRKMVEMKMNVIAIGTDTSTLKNLHGHRTGDDVSGGEILSCRSVSFHESLTFAVSENTTFTSAALSHEAAGTVDTSGMELDELGILDREASSGDHTTTVTSAGVSGGAREVGSTVATSGDDGVVGLHSVDGTVSHVVAHDTTALATLHDEVESEVLDEEDAVVAESSTEQSMKHAVAGSVGDGAASIGLTTLTHVLRLTTEGSLINLTILGSRERHAVRLKLEDSIGSFTSHVLDGVLISKPVTALDSVVEMPAPVIGMHVAKSGIDTTLSSDCVRSGREKLGDASGLVASLGQTEGGSETGTASTNDDGVVLVVDNCVVTDKALTLNLFNN